MTTSVLTRVPLPTAAEAAAEARAAVRAALAGRPTAVVDVAGLLTDELVANAVTHAGAPFELTVEVGPSWLTVEVLDWCPTPPEVVEADALAETGRGLLLVGTLAEAWGTTARGAGKAVWFRLPLE